MKFTTGFVLLYLNHDWIVTFAEEPDFDEDDVSDLNFAIFFKSCEDRDDAVRRLQASEKRRQM